MMKEGTNNTMWWVEPVIDFTAGTTAGFLGKIIEFPFDTVKVQLQSNASHHQRTSIVQTVRNIYQSGGNNSILSFYRGLPVPLAGTMLETACLFTSMTQIKHVLYGSDDEYNLSVPQVAVAGGLSGLLVSFILTPIELVKVRMQTSSVYNHSWHCVTDSIKADGLSVLYRGLTATICREVPGTAAWFATYEGCIRLFNNEGSTNHRSSSTVILSGALSGIAYSGAFYPADTVKTALQTKCGTEQSWLKVVRNISETQGLKGFYRGILPTLVRAGPANAVVFYAYERLVRVLRRES